ncbi:MAG: ankyrin repeat domain-containing protein [Clostridia bacterium]|nr:ankyrin repeat domain-containing protein [Clostridia bacterium]
MKLKFKAILGVAAIVAGMFTSIMGANANPIHDAVRAGDCEKVAVLWRQHPEWRYEEDGNGWLPIHCVNRVEVLNTLVKNGCYVGMGDHNGKTALHKAKDYAVIKRLVELGADVNARDNMGCTPLHGLVYSCFAEKEKSDLRDSVDFLVSCGADINAYDCSGKTPLAHLLATVRCYHQSADMKNGEEMCNRFTKIIFNAYDFGSYLVNKFSATSV